MTRNRLIVALVAAAALAVPTAGWAGSGGHFLKKFVPPACAQIADLTAQWQGDGRHIDAELFLNGGSCADTVYDIFVYDSQGDSGVIGGMGRYGDGESRALAFNDVPINAKDGTVTVCAVTWKSDPNVALDRWGYGEQEGYHCFGVTISQDR